MQNVELLGIVEAIQLALEMIDDQYRAIIILHDRHLWPTHNKRAKAKILLEHSPIGFCIVAVKIDVVQLHGRAYPLVRRTRAGRGQTTTTGYKRGQSSLCPAMAKSGITRSSVTVSKETAGCHRTCIAVFLGDQQFRRQADCVKLHVRVPKNESVQDG